MLKPLLPGRSRSPRPARIRRGEVTAVSVMILLVLVGGVVVVASRRWGSSPGLYPGRAPDAGATSSAVPGGAPGQGPGPGPGPGQPSGAPVPSAPATSAPPSPVGTAPATTFAVGVRHLVLRRTPERPLPTTVWYPARGDAGTVRADVPVASGRFPVVIFSHGLPSLPQTYADVTTRLAAAGFVVVAPAYPHTSSNAVMPTMADVPNQPADAFYVVDTVLHLDSVSGDPFAGHLDTARYAAAGHSAGAFTTSGMLAARHDARLAAAVVIAGSMLAPYQAPAAEVLFVHGDADRTISYRDGRLAYDLLAWPKAFLTVGGGDHRAYLTAGNRGFAPVIATITDFLRATLYGDAAARARLPADGSTDGARFEHAGG